MSMNRTVVGHTLFAEARDTKTSKDELDEWRELFLIASVIWHRAERARNWKSATHKLRHPLYGNGELWSVCVAPFQFSCWNGDDYTIRMSDIDETGAVDSKNMAYSDPDREALRRCFAVATTLVYYDNTGRIAMFLSDVKSQLPTNILVDLATEALKTEVTLYHAKNMPTFNGAPVFPAWSKAPGVAKVTEAGGHIFYNETPTLQEAASR